jgi:hypothetical protein
MSISKDEDNTDEQIKVKINQSATVDITENLIEEDVVNESPEKDVVESSNKKLINIDNEQNVKFHHVVASSKVSSQFAQEEIKIDDV